MSTVQSGRLDGNRFMRKINHSPIKMSELAIALVLLFATENALAACIGPRGVNVDFSFGRIIVPRDQPAGSTIRRITLSTPGAFGCDVPWRQQGYLTRFTKKIEESTASYHTNIPNVAIAIHQHTSFFAQSPDNFIDRDANFYFGPENSYTIILHKYTSAPVGGGAITPGRAAVFCMHHEWCMSSINIVNSEIVPVACSVTSSPPPIPLGDTFKKEFSGIGSSTKEVGVTIPLNCDAETRVNITIDGVSAGSGLPGVLALNDPSATATAKGVGVQLMVDGSPVTLGTRQLVGTTTAAGPYEIPLSARYYQTGASIEGGLANATATFTVTYQ